MAVENARRLLSRHPLQRQESPSRGASALLHVIGLASFAYSFSYLVNNPNPINESYGWHLQFLTIIGLLLATITFAFGLAADMTLSPDLFAVKNSLSIASAPLECLITMLYWGLRAIDPKLVLPDIAEVLDLPTDMSFHAIPAIALVLDLLFFSPPYTIAFGPALGLSSLIAFGYWIWIEQCFRYNHFYPYPLFAMLTTPQRAGLFIASAVLMTLTTAALIWLYGMINGTEMHEHTNGYVREPQTRGKRRDLKGT